MNTPKDSHPENNSDFIQKYMNQDMYSAPLDYESDSEFESLTLLEETLVEELYPFSFAQSDWNSESPYESFREELDIAKAYMAMKEDLAPVPEYLLRYADMNLGKPERKKSLIVRLAQHGIQVLDSLSLGLSLKPTMALSPELRSAVAQSPLTSNDAGFVVFEEKVQDGQRFYYQMVRETPQEVFLSIKIDDSRALDLYKQVILRRDGRFVLSSKIGPEGIVNFSGLREGAYSVEFLSSPSNKIIDLYLILD